MPKETCFTEGTGNQVQRNHWSDQIVGLNMLGATADPLTFVQRGKNKGITEVGDM